jgi:4-hydroxybenzoate polyprenyltransferase
VNPVRTASALARSCHPAPTVAVTCFTTVLGAAAGNGAGTCTLLAVAVLAGQLSIGWSNDRIDAARDRTAGRTDKPLASGELALRTADMAIALALLTTVAFSLSLGWRAGLLHLGAVGCGWIYNAELKSTWWSWLPYAAAFGALPAIATLALPTPTWPAAWAVVAGALFGAAANLTNALPDLAGDRLTGVVGLPHHLGARPSLLTAVALLIAATCCAAFGPPGATTALGWAALALSVLAAVAGAVLAFTRPTSKISFYGIVAVVGLDLVLIVVDGHHLH